jgi:hypothetical protein
MKTKSLFERRSAVQAAVLLAALIALVGCPQREDSNKRNVAAKIKSPGGGSAQDAGPAPEPDLITLKWTSLGGESVVGAATSEITTTTDGLARYQTFQNGVIVYTNDGGIAYIPKTVFDYWLSLKSTGTPWGLDGYSYLAGPHGDAVTRAGYTKSTHDVPGSYVEAVFVRGRIIVDPSGTPHAIYGCLDVRFGDSWVNLGAPVTDLRDGPNARHYQQFERGNIYTNLPEDAAYVVSNSGRIWDKWIALGGLGGSFGYPTADSGCTLASGSGLTVCSGRFEGGVIYGPVSSSGLATVDIPLTDPWNKLLEVYEANGGATGWLGLPTKRASSAKTNKTYLDCQFGIIVLDDAAVPHVFGNLTFHFERIAGYNGDALSPTDTYVYLDLYNAKGQVYSTADHQKFSCGKDQSDCDINAPDWILTNPLDGTHADFMVTVKVDGADENFGFWSSDGDLGTVTQAYDIDNLWGMSLPNLLTAYGSDGKLEATFWINNTFDCPSSDFRQCSYWRFHNVHTDDIGWEAYSAAFTDVDPDEYNIVHPLNWLYYTYIADSIGEDGTCYGMTLQSIYDQVGRGYAEPIHQWSLDKKLHRQIDIRQVQQLGYSQLIWALEKIGTGNTHDPQETYDEGKEYQDRADYPMIHLYSGTIYGSAHTVRPYRFADSKIYVADPNYEVTNDTGEPGPENFIEIKDDGCFSYKPGNGTGETWHGCTWDFDKGDARMTYTPFSKVSGPQQTPLAYRSIEELLSDSLFFITGSDVSVVQATDDQGRTLFKSDLSRLPTKWADLQSGDNRIPTLSPIPVPSDRALRGQLLGGRGVSGVTHKFDVLGTTADKTYEVGVSTGLLTAHFSVPGTPEKADIITMRKMNQPDKAVAFKLPADTVEKTITATVSGVDRSFWGQLKSMKVVPSQEIAIQTSNGGKTFIVSNDGPPTTACLSVSDSKTKKTSDGACPLPIPSGTTTIPMAAPVARCRDMGSNFPSQCTAGANIDAGSYDPQGSLLTSVQSPTELQLGRNTVTLTVTNKAGFSDSCSAIVTIYDTTKPHFTSQPADVVSDPCTGQIGDLGSAQAEDNCPGDVTVTNDAPASYPMGVTVVTWTAKDVSGNIATYQQKVTRISDTTRPTFTVKPDSITSDPCTGVVGPIGMAQASDNCPGTVTVTNDAPATYRMGITTVTWTATDVAGNWDTYQQTITVTTDTTRPSFTVKPTNVASDPCTGAVGPIGNAQAADNCPGTVTVTNNAPVTYPKGATTVTWTATDAAGNVSTYDQTVTVTSDTTPPVFTAQPGNVASTVCSGTPVIGTATATDNCGGLTVTNDAPATYPIGTTTVTWTATDNAGNKATYQQTVKLDQALDLGAEHVVSTVNNDACLAVTKYPDSWSPYVHSLIVQPQETGVGFPIPFTWKNCSTTGNGTLPGPWLQGTVSSVVSACKTLIKLGGNGSGNVALTWWGNG